MVDIGTYIPIYNTYLTVSLLTSISRLNTYMEYI